MNSNKDFFSKKSILFFYGSFESPLFKTPPEKILALGDVIMTSYGIIEVFTRGTLELVKFSLWSQNKLLHRVPRPKNCLWQT